MPSLSWWKRVAGNKDRISTFCPGQSSFCHSQLWINKHHPKWCLWFHLKISWEWRLGGSTARDPAGRSKSLPVLGTEAALAKQFRSRLYKLNKQRHLLNTQSSLPRLYLAAVSRLMDRCSYPVSAACQGALSHPNSCNCRPLATKVKLQTTCPNCPFQMVLLLL